MKMYKINYCLIIILHCVSTFAIEPTKDIIPSPNKPELSGLKTRRVDSDEYDEEVFSNTLHDESLPFVDNEVPATARPYLKPGGWATPPPDSGIDLGFTPVQTYLQVRRTSTVKRLPRSEAIKEASSLDEVLNAHRLKEVLRTKKIQEVYSEEGYEDSGYDHGNHERHAEHDEGYNHHNGGKYKVKDPVQHIHDVADSESRVIEKNSKPRSNKPKYSRKRVESTSMKFAYMNDEKKKKPEINETNTRNVARSKKYKRAPKERVRERKEKPSDTVKRDFVSPKGDFWNFPSSFEDLPVNKWGANFEPMTRRKEKSEDVSNKVRIPAIPTFGYIHSLTDAHYGSQAPMTYVQPKPIPSHVINLTESLRPKTGSTNVGFEPKRIRKRIKRSILLRRNTEADEYEEELKNNLDEQEKNIITSALKNLKVVNDVDEKYPLFRPLSQPTFQPRFPWKTVGYDSQKYPYFNSQNVDSHSPLRYASHPREFPVKSGYGMEFYDERDRAVQCEEVNVSLDDVPKENSTKELSEQPGEKKRIVGLGDKIQCLKIKYFGEDPLDSPFFKEDELKKFSTTPSSLDGLKYHSSYQYQPNQSLDIFVKGNNSDSNVESTEERVQYQVHHPEPVKELIIENFSPNERIKYHQNHPETIRESKTEDFSPDQRIKYHQSHPETIRESKTEDFSPDQRIKYHQRHPEAIRESKTENFSTAERIKYHGRHPEPNKDTKIESFTEDFRVIPVRENYPDLTTNGPIRGMRPPPAKFSHLPLSLIRLPKKQKPAKLMKTVKFNNYCLQPVTKMTISERSDEDVMYDCLDAKLLQTTLNGNIHFKIMPKRKTRRSDLMNFLIDDSLEFRAGEVIENQGVLTMRKKRSAPTRRKSNLFPNKSLLDKIIRRPTFETNKNGTQNSSKAEVDLGVRSPDEIPETKETPTTKKIEVIKKEATTSTTSTTTISPSSTAEAVIMFEPRPLKRLSGRDFLVRYHKTKGPKTVKQIPKNDFWKVSESKLTTSRPIIQNKGESSIEETQVSKYQVKTQRVQSVKRDERSNMKGSEKEGIDRSWNEEVEQPGPTPVLLYVVDEATGKGQWISKETSTETPPSSSTKKTNERQMKKQNARKMFFNKKLNKNL